MQACMHVRVCVVQPHTSCVCVRVCAYVFACMRAWGVRAPAKVRAPCALQCPLCTALAWHLAPKHHLPQSTSHCDGHAAPPLCPAALQRGWISVFGSMSDAAVSGEGGGRAHPPWALPSSASCHGAWEPSPHEAHMRMRAAERGATARRGSVHSRGSSFAQHCLNAIQAVLLQGGAARMHALVPAAGLWCMQLARTRACTHAHNCRDPA